MKLEITAWDQCCKVHFFPVYSQHDTLNFIRMSQHALSYFAQKRYVSVFDLGRLLITLIRSHKNLQAHMHKKEPIKLNMALKVEFRNLKNKYMFVQELRSTSMLFRYF